jgi:iron complex outermembrane recepter protein
MKPLRSAFGRRSTRRRAGRTGLALVLLAGSAAGAAAQQPDLVNMTLEDLMKIEVTSASRHEQRLINTAAAVYVITQDDIRRSGLTTIPEILRLAPGIHVARVRANIWAVAVRGFNQQYSDKLLVLVDGRTVYNTDSSGVYWDTVDVMVEDIDRIEIVRGPGGAVWGANAVNGVINILTKSAADTQGSIVRATLGTQAAGTTAVRYGDTTGDTAYRAYGRWSERGHGLLDRETAAYDGSRSASMGFRLDRASGADTLTVQGDVVDVDTDFVSSSPRGIVPPPEGWTILTNSTNRVSNLLGRVTRRLPRGHSVDVQGFVTHHRSEEAGQFYRALTLDAELKYQARAGRHAIVSGTGYRQVDDRATGSFAAAFTPEKTRRRVFNAFVQDEVHFADDRLLVTLGTKVEHHTISGWGVQPTARALWAVTPRQRLWTAVSRALRTPSRVDLGLNVFLDGSISAAGLPVLVLASGNPEYKTEELTSLEGGYRVDLGSAASIDAAVFYGDHGRLLTFEPFAPIFTPAPVPHLVVGGQFGNLMSANTSGVEITGQWPVAPWWRVNGAYTFFRIEATLDEASRDLSAPAFVRGTPQHQVQARSAWSLGPRVDLYLSLLSASALTLRGVPGYRRADANLEWRVAPHWTVSANAQNLFNGPHLEFAGPEVSGTPSLDPRRAGVRVIWTY